MTKMSNRSVIKGDNNISVSGINKSKVSIENAGNSKSKGQFWVITGVIVALIALLVQIFVGWDQIIKWL